jgi:hypothetical protein
MPFSNGRSWGESYEWLVTSACGVYTDRRRLQGGGGGFKKG